MGAGASVEDVAEIVFPLAGAAITATVAAVAAIRQALDRSVKHQPGAEEKEEYPLPKFLEPYFKKRRVNIAITGESGIGKSSLVNVILGRDVAKVGGIKETTKAAQHYEHPIGVCKDLDGHVYLWDLPGGGTPKVPLETYIQDMGMRYFDAAIVVLHNRVKEANVFIIKELQKFEIPFLCVVNKMDAIVDDAKRDTEPLTLEDAFQLVSNSYESEFKEAGCKDVVVFRLSARALKENRGFSSKDPLNRDWESFKRALVSAVCRSRGWERLVYYLGPRQL